MVNKSNSLDELLKQIKITEIIQHYGVKIQTKGNSLLALCPFHDDKNPSMSISSSKNIFKCWACNAAGNGIAFIQKYDQLDWKTALKKAIEICGIKLENWNSNLLTKVDPKQKRYWEINNALITYYQTRLKRETNPNGMNYLVEKRKLNKTLIEQFQLGLAFHNEDKYLCESMERYPFINPKIKPSELYLFSKTNQQGLGFFDFNTKKATFQNQIMIPIHDFNGNPVGFSARSVDNINKLKYKNSADHEFFKKGELLFNFHRLNKNLNQLFIVEGYFDVFTLTNSKFEAVALMGLALNDVQIKAIKAHFKELQTLVLALDNDASGQNAVFSLIEKLNNNNFIVEIVQWEHNYKDWDELYLNKGSEQVILQANKRQNLIEYLVSFFKKQQLDQRVITNKIIAFLTKNQTILNDHSFLIFLIKNLVKLLEYSDEKTLYETVLKHKEKLVSKFDNNRFYINTSGHAQPPQELQKTTAALVQTAFEEAVNELWKPEIFAFALIDKRFLVELKQSHLDEVFKECNFNLFDVELFIEKARIYWSENQTANWVGFESVLDQNYLLNNKARLLEIKDIFLDELTCYQANDFQNYLKTFQTLLKQQKQRLKNLKLTL